MEIVTSEEMRRIDAPALLLKRGQKLTQGLVEIGTGFGYTVKTSGHPSMPYVRLTDDASQSLHQAWCGECTKRGAFLAPHHNWFLSTAHTEADIERTFSIAEDAFRAIKRRFGGAS